MNETDDFMQHFIQNILASARLANECGNHEEAEDLCNQALEQAQLISGINSFLVGIVLFDLLELYDAQGRLEEAKQVSSKLRRIVMLRLEKFVS